MNSKILAVCSLTILLCSTSGALAQDATPTPTPVPQVQVCAPVQDCASNGLSELVEECYAATPACVSTNHDKNAVTAELVAQRAISARACDTRQFSSRGACAACYRSAARPVVFRQDGVLFHGLLGYARAIIADAGRTRCATFPARTN